jgi:hypothetical protein
MALTPRAGALAALLLLPPGGCSEPLSGKKPTNNKELQAMSKLSGTIQVDGQPNSGAEAFLLDASGKVVALTKTDSTGGYSLSPPAGYTGGWILAKLYHPVIGCRAMRVDGTVKTIDFSIAAGETVVLSGELRPPEGIKPDWVDVHVTPRQPRDVPPEAKEAILLVDTGSSMRSTYFTERVKGSSFRFRVLPGVYDLRADRTIDAPLTAKLPVPNLTAAALKMPDGSEPKQTFGGYLLDVGKDLQVVLTLRKADEM